jgi:Adenine-specific DNA methylase containing a Zn-ribbon
MSEQLSFIEKQFPVSKVSKESYKERKAVQGQTLTGLGKWWGRKPLILVRTAIIGSLMPASDNPDKDMEIFLKILSMDNKGLLLRKEKRFAIPELYNTIQKNKRLSQQYLFWFDNSSNKLQLHKDAPREEIEEAAYQTLGYDAKISMCIRPEQISELDEHTWNEINQHLGTSAHSLIELIKELSMKRYGHNIIVGDCFSGGGSIPFEAARIGCDTYASDLNPIAGLLTWADLNICGAKEKDLDTIKAFQEAAYTSIDKEICELGIEHNELGDRALSYLYCMETHCPECGYRVPLLPSLVVGIRAGKVISVLRENGNSFDIEIISNVSDAELKKAQTNGTVRSNSLICPHCEKATPISSLRHDSIDASGNIIYGLRLWGQNEFESREDDIYHERLYAIRYEKPDGKRYYCAPSKRDLQNEEKVHSIVANNFDEWQKSGLIPSIEIENGYNTDQLIRERGWKYWHQLFNVRQLFVLSRLALQIKKAPTQIQKVAGILGLNKCADFSSRLCRWDPSTDKIAQTFYNQALNTLMNYGTRSFAMLNLPWYLTINEFQISGKSTIVLKDAHDITDLCDFWITDPPYADAVNYHELSEYFLAWDKGLLKDAFPDWYTDSKRILAVKGDEHFSRTMIDIYSNLTKHMNDDGLQVVMFTHSDPAVWAQLAIIMWKAGLKVTAAWNIATETDASGLKNGNYVKGTVLLVLRKQTGDDMAFLDEINSDIKNEVKSQIESMQKLDDKEEPNFSDPDYVLAAYAASLKVLTAYATIEDLNLDFELNQAIQNPAGSKIVTIIENAKKIAYDCVIPLEFDSFLWRELTNAEKFYIKGLESEKHGNYQIGTYQEFARGFSIGGYSQLMANERANTARLKTPYEMASRTINDIPDFENSLMRIIFSGIYVGIKEDRNPNKALGFIKNELSNYWDKREMIQQILAFLISNKDISNMQLHWAESADMAELLLALVSHDSI